MKRLLLLFLLPAVALAQRTTVDGSTNPVGIPDEAAARAVFSVHSMFGTPADIGNSAKQRDKIGLSVADRVIYDAAMQAHYSAIQGNDGAAQAATLNGLNQTLSADGQAKLKAFIQKEKVSMHYVTQRAIVQKVGGGK